MTKLNEPGPELQGDEIEAIASATVDAARGTAWVALSGSLPPVVPADLYAPLTRQLVDAGAKVAVDSSGRALVAALRLDASLDMDLTLTERS